MILHMRSLQSTYPVKYTMADSHFFVIDLAKCGCSNSTASGPPLTYLVGEYSGGMSLGLCHAPSTATRTC